MNARSDSPTRFNQKIVRFVLKEALTAGGSAEAYLRICKVGGSFLTTTKVITVYDDTGGRDGDIGDRGVAVFMPDSGHYEIIDKVCTP